MDEAILPVIVLTRVAVVRPSHVIESTVGAGRSAAGGLVAGTLDTVTATESADSCLPLAAWRGVERGGLGRTRWQLWLG